MVVTRYFLVLVCFSCVVYFHFKQLICAVLCLFCLVFPLFVTGLSGIVVCILWSSFLFCILFGILFFLFFSFLSKNDQKPDTAKTQKCKHAENISVSAVVFTSSVPNFLGWAKTCRFLLKTLWKAWFQRQKAKTCQKGWVKTWSKVESKLGPSMLRNIIRPSFDSKKRYCLSFFLLKSHSSCRKKKIFERKKNKEENLDQVLTPQKAIIGPSFDSTASAYIYMYMYRHTFSLRIFGPVLTLIMMLNFRSGCCIVCLT